MGYQNNFSTFVTVPGVTSELFATGEDWMQIVLSLETAGPVAIGQNQNLLPVSGGSSRLLPSNRDVPITLPPHSRLYVAAATVNRVSVMTMPYPWLAQIFLSLSNMVSGLLGGSKKASGDSSVDIGAFGFRGKMPTKK